MTAIPGSLASLPGELTYFSGYATPLIVEEGSLEGEGDLATRSKARSRRPMLSGRKEFKTLTLMIFVVG